jgi:polyhydroxyalkanoate synthesis repressor PhaR
MPNKVLIKKYENRRLYDTTNSRYVNLDEVAQMVRDGIEIEVVDAASSEDITRLILAQIIMEQAKGPDSVYPLDMLRQMVAASGRASQEGALKYMKAMFDMYQNAYRAFPAVTPFGFMQNMVQPTVPANGPPPNGGTTTAAPPPPSGDDVSELKRRIDELEALIARRGAASRKKKKE